MKYIIMNRLYGIKGHWMLMHLHTLDAMMIARAIPNIGRIIGM